MNRKPLTRKESDMAKTNSKRDSARNTQAAQGGEVRDADQRPRWPDWSYYHQTDGYYYEPRDYDEYLNEAQFNYFVGTWKESVYVPQLTQIA